MATAGSVEANSASRNATVCPRNRSQFLMQYWAEAFESFQIVA